MYYSLGPALWLRVTTGVPKSTLTLGFLGLNAAEYLQKAIHALTDSDVANGWQNQISAGGEPTAMFTLSTQLNHSRVQNSSRRHPLKTAYETNAGFSTDINASLSFSVC